MTNDERKHKEKLAAMGCVICTRLFGNHEPGAVQLHHLRSGGWGKGDYRTLIPLCVVHHLGNEGIHGMGTKRFEREYGVTQQELLDAVLLNVGS
jgi:hypothetical protein